MKSIKCLIVEDEPLARQQLESYISKLPHLSLAGSAKNVVQAQLLLKAKEVDLLFLDIKMPGMNGIEFLRSHQPHQQIVIISAYQEYALEGFELEVTDYLLKPVSFERFAIACQKALSKHILNLSSATTEPAKEFLYIKCDQRVEKLTISSILYLESMLNYVSIHTTSGRFIVYSSLKAMESALPKEKFIRIHKSYLIASEHVQTISHRQLTIGQINLPISRSNRNKMLQLANRLSLNAPNKR